MLDNETLRTYASILLKPWREFDSVLKRDVLREPGEIRRAASAALTFQAELLELASDSRVSDAIIGLRVRNSM